MARKKQPIAAIAMVGEKTEKKRKGKPPVEKPKVTDELFQMHANAALRERTELDKKTQERSAQNARYRGVLAKAKKDGIDPDEIIWWLDHRARTPEDMAAEAKRNARIARIMKMDVGYQMTFADVDVEEVVDRGTLQHRAYEAGHKAGLAAANHDTNPYIDGDSDLQQRWSDGWNDGQAELSRPLGRGKNGGNGHSAEASAATH